MLKKYSLAIKLSSFIVIIFTLLVTASVYLYSGSFKIFLNMYHFILPSVLLLFLCCFLIIHIRVENFVYLRVKSIYEDLKNYYSIYQGTYSWVTGPTYETPSEIKIIKKMGGDVIGMSTLPELVKAYQYGMNIIGISCLSNYASGISNEQLTHNDVLNVVSKSNKNFSNLLFDIIKLI